jgi:hypothetical protein
MRFYRFRFREVNRSAKAERLTRFFNEKNVIKATGHDSLKDANSAASEVRLAKIDQCPERTVGQFLSDGSRNAYGSNATRRNFAARRRSADDRLQRRHRRDQVSACSPLKGKTWFIVPFFRTWVANACQ